MQTFNNKIVEALSRTASQLREDADVLGNDSDALLKRAAVLNHLEGETETTILDVKVLAAAPSALRRRALRQWISETRGSSRRLEMVHLLAVEKLLEGTAAGREVAVPGRSRVKTVSNGVKFETPEWKVW